MFIGEFLINKIMISAYRFNYEHIPKEVRMNTFDAERSLIYNEIIRLFKDFEMRYNNIHN